MGWAYSMEWAPGDTSARTRSMGWACNTDWACSMGWEHIQAPEDTLAGTRALVDTSERMSARTRSTGWACSMDWACSMGWEHIRAPVDTSAGTRALVGTSERTLGLRTLASARTLGKWSLFHTLASAHIQALAGTSEHTSESRTLESARTRALGDTSARTQALEDILELARTRSREWACST